jgi:hypothetical protein
MGGGRHVDSTPLDPIEDSSGLNNTPSKKHKATAHFSPDVHHGAQPSAFSVGRVISPGRPGSSAPAPFDMEKMLQLLRGDQLSSEARIGGLVKENCESVKIAINSRIDRQEDRINSLADAQGTNSKLLADLQAEIKIIKQGKSYSQAAAHAGAARPEAPAVAPRGVARAQPPCADDATAFEVENLLFFQRRCGVLKGFARDTEDEVINLAMHAFAAHWKCDLVDGGYRVPFALGSTGKMGFKSAQNLRGIAAQNRKDTFIWEKQTLWLSVGPEL